MPSSGMLHRVAHVRADISEELITFVIRVTRIGVLRLLVTANVHSSPILITLMMKAIHFSETSVLRRATQPNIPEGSFSVA
jgi:hypothetical protein